METVKEETRICAQVSRSTKALLERQVRATGLKRGRLIEQALRNHFRGLQELPADIIVQAELVVTRRSRTTVSKGIDGGKPTRSLRQLMRDRE